MNVMLHAKPNRFWRRLVGSLTRSRLMLLDTEPEPKEEKESSFFSRFGQFLATLL